MFAQQFKSTLMTEHKTDKELLVKGLQTMGICLVLMFLGPTLLYIAFSNQDKSTFILVLILAILVCILAIFFMFRGLRIIMKSVFHK